MKAIIQRVLSSDISVDNEIISKINKGFLVFLGVTHDDTIDQVKELAKKIINLRIFNDNAGKMNLSIKDSGGEILVISQFTLYADCSHGNRPSFINAAKKEPAENLYNLFIEELKLYDLNIYSGVFGADMKVGLINDGPVTIILDADNI